MVTQGRADKPYWVKSYKVYYSDDGVNFKPVLSSDNTTMVFPGNSDQWSTVKHMLPKPVMARYIRIRPVTFHGKIGLRFDLIGCVTPYAAPTIMPTRYPVTPYIIVPEGELLDIPLMFRTFFYCKR